MAGKIDRKKIKYENRLDFLGTVENNKSKIPKESFWETQLGRGFENWLSFILKLLASQCTYTKSYRFNMRGEQKHTCIDRYSILLSS